MSRSRSIRANCLRGFAHSYADRRSRAAPEPTGPRSPDANLVRFGPLSLDMEGRRLVRDDGAIVALTTMEFELLAVFSRNPNRVLTRDRLLDLAHHRGTEPFDRSIDIRVARLRRKIEPDPSRPQVIKTMHGSGYMFVSPTS